MSERVEGTVKLDGLLEGRLSSAPEIRERLREWEAFAASNKLAFNLQFEGDTFSLLAEPVPVPVEMLGDEPAETVRQALEQLLKLFPPEERRTLVSTIRSIEYRKGAEVQTLYYVAPDGSIRIRERTLSASTTPPPKRFTPREKVYVVSIAVLVALLVLALSSFFVDYRVMFRALLEGIIPLDANELTVETPHFQQYFTIEGKTLSDSRKTLILTLKRTDAFLRDEVALQAALEKAKPSITACLAVEALARGYVRCEYFDRDEKFLGFSLHRIAGLSQAETVKINVPLPEKGRLARLVITY